MANPFSNKLKQAGLVIFGGLLSAVSGFYAVSSGGVSLPEVSSTAESVKVFVADQEFNAFVSATGSTSNTQRYAAACIPNPLTQLPTSAGTGRLIGLSLEVGNNPAGARGDLYFTKNCNDKTTTGTTVLINNTCAFTGCVSYFAQPLAFTGALWNGADYIKYTMNKDPTSSFTARIRGNYEDVFGE